MSSREKIYGVFKGTNLQLVVNQTLRSKAQYSEHRQHYYTTIL